MSAWPSRPIEECCEIVSGATPSTSEEAYWDGDVCWATPKDLSELEGPYITDTPRKITRAGLASCAAKILPPESVLFSSRAPIGHVAINTVPMATNQGFKSFVPKGERVVPKFLYYWLRAHRKQLESMGNGATFKEVSKAVVSRIQIPVPPVAEQRRIADVLDRAEALRAKRRAALAKLDTLTQAIFLDMFGTSHAGERTIGDLLSMGAIELHKDGNHGSSYPRADDFGEHGVPFLSARAISDDGVIDDSAIERLAERKAQTLKIGWLRKGDVLLAHNASVGKVALYDGQYERALIGTSLTAFRPNQKCIDPEYLAAALRSMRFQESLRKNMSQTTRNQVPITAQRQLELLVPPIGRQRDFAQRVKLVHALKARQGEALAMMSNELLVSIQERAFRGELF